MRKPIASIMSVGLLSLGLNSVYAASCDSASQLCNLHVLIEQNSIELSQLQALLVMAPNLQQLHLRVDASFLANDPAQGPPYTASTPSVQKMVGLINTLSASNPNLVFGFHPDNSATSYGIWGCPVPATPTPIPTPMNAGMPAYPPTWSCVFNNGIAYMNAVNALLPAGHKLSIYSLEQSDVESPAGPSTDVANPTADDVLFEKKCLTGSAVPGLCAAAQVANPAVQYGYVAGSCGASNLYDMQHFDYGYPQMYNLYHSWSTAKSSPLGLPPEAFSGGSPDPSVTYTTRGHKLRF